MDSRSGIPVPTIVTDRAPHGHLRAKAGIEASVASPPLPTESADNAAEARLETAASPIAPFHAGRRALVISRPIPPIREEPTKLRADVPPEMLLSVDRTNYLVSENEFPSYAVTGAVPNQAILWSLWLNDRIVVENQPFATDTDGDGNWSGIGSPWIKDHVGLWRVLAKTGGREASVHFVVSADIDGPEVTPPSEMLGVTHVGGLYRFATPDSELEPESFLVEGAKHIRNLGARHLFVYLSPQYKSDYPFDDFGEETYASLTALAESPPYRELFSLPFETFVLTAYTFANWRWIQSRGQVGAVPFDADEEREELANLTRHLAATYPGKAFILKNWEGDWQMKLSYELDAVASEEQIAEFIHWMRARQEGIVEGRRNSESQNVNHAIEFNLIHQAQRGLPSMLASVMPAADSDLIAYASWWSLTRGGDLIRIIRDDITFVRSLPGIGSRSLIVTEFGFSHLDPELDRRTADSVRAFSAAHVPLALYWQIFDNGPGTALVGPELTRFPSWHRLRTFLGVRNDAAFDADQTRLPPRIVSGRQYPVTIAVRNRGLLFDPVLGYALGLFDSQNRLQQFVWVRREVPTGEVVVLEFVLNAPETAGAHSLRMFQHGVDIFGEEMAVEVHPDTGAASEER